MAEARDGVRNDPEHERLVIELIRAAADRWGVGFELKMLAQSWGDTLDDAEMFDVITTFAEKGVHLSQPRRMVDPHNSDRTI